MMHSYKRFEKEAIIKFIFGGAIAVTACFSLWLGRFYPPTLNGAEKVEVIQAVKQGNVEQNQGEVFLVNQAASVLEEESTLVPAPESHLIVPGLPNLTHAAKLATTAVVYIKAVHNAKVVKRSLTPFDQLFREFFGDGFDPRGREYERPEQCSFGSGVLYSSDGYIITNEHVIAEADRIEITLNDLSSYEAKLIGKDPSTDLALLKIEGGNFPFLKLGDSDKLEVGEWVLAVGHPFNLITTVTKGIVSAKHRTLMGTEEGERRFQGFIQTDAAMNRGNSGGALVNLYGELVGINSVIYASGASTFMGYGFAIPVSLVKKVIGDLVKYGKVQRVLLGIGISDVDDNLVKRLKLTTPVFMKQFGLTKMGGVYISHVTPNSPCAKLVEKEDIIVGINGRKIVNACQLQEVVACAKPGDKLTLTLYRKGKERTISVILDKVPGTVEVIQRGDNLQVEGAIFQNLDEKTKTKYKLSNGGVLVKEVAKGRFQEAGLKKGCILLELDKQPVKDVDTLAKLLRNTTDSALLKIMDPAKGMLHYLAVDFGSGIMK